MQHNLQNGRTGNREDDAQQAKVRPTNQNRDHCNGWAANRRHAAAMFG
jgi:hypothetical protein